MGGGASAQQVHASAGDDKAEAQLRSLLPSGHTLSAPILSSLKEYNFLVDAIAMDDAVLISDALGTEHRHYDELSERLLTKTRGQLQRVRRMYAASSALAGGDSRELVSDLRTLLQGQYGGFVTNLFRTKDEYNIYQLESAMAGLGCDEDLVIDILCGTPPHEFERVQAAVTAEDNEVFGLEVFEGKLLAGSVLQKFILKLLKGKRNEEGLLHDAATVLKHVDELMECKKMVDVDRMLELVCTLSRSECEAVNKKLYLQHFITLPAYISSVVSNATAARAIMLWTLPPRRAILHALHHGIYGTAYHADDHSIAVCRIVSAQDKREMVDLREEYQRVYNKSLFEELSIYLAGNIKSAMDTFINHPVFDNDFEKKMIAVVNDAAQGELSEELMRLLDEECALLKHYRSKSETMVAQAKMRILNASQPSPRPLLAIRSLSMEQLHLPPIASKMTPIKQSPTKKSFAPTEGGTPASIETDLGGEDAEPPNLLPYLVDLYDAHHPNEEGQIPVEQFWKMIVDDVFRHSFTEYDVARLKKKFKAEGGDGLVAWKDAISYLTVQIKIMKSEKKDLWLGLKMLTPGPEKWFWFNIRDEMSFWMSAEEQMQFKKCIVMSREEQPAKWLLPSAFRHVLDEVPTPKTMAQSTKAANRRKRRSTFGEIDTPTASSIAKKAVAVPGQESSTRSPTKKTGNGSEATISSPAAAGKVSIPAKSIVIPHASSQKVTSVEPTAEKGDDAAVTQSEKVIRPEAAAPTKIPYDPKFASSSIV